MAVKICIELKKKPDITSYPLVIVCNHTPIEISTPMIDCPETSKENTKLLDFARINIFRNTDNTDDVDNFVSEEIRSTNIIIDISKQAIQVYQIYNNKRTLAWCKVTSSLNPQ